jgi:hypothetical protein
MSGVNDLFDKSFGAGPQAIDCTGLHNCDLTA